MSEAQTSVLARIPAHVAIIMDGNGRWAKARSLPRLAGHKAGTENLRRVIIKACAEFGIKYLTVFAFSSENWNRPQDEVQGLMRIMGEALEREVPELNRQGARILHVGSEENMPVELRDGVRRAVELTKNNQTITVCVAGNYGGRAEIVNAVRRIIAAGTPAEAVDEALISHNLYTAGIPDPDLVIRTSGELRTSNFCPGRAPMPNGTSPPVLAGFGRGAAGSLAILKTRTPFWQAQRKTLAKRVSSGVLIFIFCLSIAVAGGWWFSVGIGLILCGAAWEFAEMFRGRATAWEHALHAGALVFPPCGWSIAWLPAGLAGATLAAMGLHVFALKRRAGWQRYEHQPGGRCTLPGWAATLSRCAFCRTGWHGCCWQSFGGVRRYRRTVLAAC